MPSVLETIIANKRKEVDSGKYSVDVRTLDASNRSLLDSIKSRSPGLILECKAASPSKGLIALDYQPQKLAMAYQHFAAAISVLTDEKFFKGNMSHLKIVSETTDLPVLCKDFFISKEQIICARSHGADAILLMLSVLSNDEYEKLRVQAKLLDLDILTEVHDEAELDRAIELSAKIIGINNRNLGTLKIDMNTTHRLASRVPQHSLLVSESGYSSRGQFVDSFAAKRAPNGFLVGSHLSASKDTSLSLRELLFGSVKICGLTRIADALAAYESGAVYGGLIFSENSKRNISVNKAEALVGKVRLKWVGVFTENSINAIVETANKLNLSAVQIHWQISKQQLKELRDSLPLNCEIWTLIRVEQSATTLIDIMNSDNISSRFLIEPKGELAGGNGIQFNWNLLNHDSIDKSKIVLAGGINPDNIKQATAMGVSIIDVNSGVEDAPGIKSEIKISKLFQQLQLGNQL